jgi:hypothetical protein
MIEVESTNDLSFARALEKQTVFVAFARRLVAAVEK